jgi:sensor histidine kinase regulating citrate/malate metabolism
MAWKKTKLPKTDALVTATAPEIKRELDGLRESAHKAFQTRRRFWFHTVLEGAYALNLEWKEDGNAKNNAKAAAALFGVKREKGDHPLSTIVKVVKPKGVDSRDWVTGLQSAYEQGVAPKDLIAFLQGNGGIRGCARRLKPKK